MCLPGLTATEHRYIVAVDRGITCANTSTETCAAAAG
jgi:hypothetical protein